jgi:hypothetical protein
MSNGREKLAHNPFYVLGVSTDAGRVEIEREGQKLLGMLELGLSAAKHAATPLGKIERSAELVRVALAELRDPEKRLRHELRARLKPELVLDPALDFDQGPPPPRPAAWPEVRSALGWEGPKK